MFYLYVFDDLKNIKHGEDLFGSPITCRSLLLDYRLLWLIRVQAAGIVSVARRLLENKF